MLYESTGLEGQSSLRIVDIITGKPVKMIALAQEFFGEGITLFNEQIFQLTYKTKVGFVYDKNTLQKIRSFDYPMDEGWGLTSNGKNLIMSDGSEQLYFMDPEFFTQTGRVEVFDNQGRIRQLNELEYVRGKILANVYGEGYILIINAETGKVTGKLNLQALIPEGFQGDFGRVLNGIAFNPENGNLYVTGKNWPVLYEIAVSPSLTF
jgi:glutamine cyclotransferase